MIQLALALFGLSALWMATGDNLHARRWAPVVGLCGQPFWIAFAIDTGAWGLLALSAAYTAVYVRGAWVQWTFRRRNRRARSAMDGLTMPQPVTRTYSSIEVVDWFRLLWDMVQRGHSINWISRKTGIAHSTLLGYHEGTQPPHWRGELLIGLWAAVCDKPVADKPMTELVLAPRVVYAKPAVKAQADALAELAAVAKGWRAGT